MKLLLDENLSRRLVPLLQHDYPGSTQVALVGLERASDRDIWAYAKAGGFVIVTRDADFSELSVLQGHPPQVIWLRTSNRSRAAVLDVLLKHRELIEQALVTENRACVELLGRPSRT